jgi:hypothetical protein
MAWKSRPSGYYASGWGRNSCQFFTGFSDLDQGPGTRKSPVALVVGHELIVRRVRMIIYKPPAVGPKARYSLA